MAERNEGAFGGYTSTRRPVTLLWAEHFREFTEAIAAERQLKGWSPAKKEALIRGDFAASWSLARRQGQDRVLHPSFETPRFARLIRMR